MGALWETTVRPPLWVSVGKPVAERGRGPSVCLCSQEPRSPAVSFQHLTLRKLDVLVTVEVLKEIVAVHILKGDFGIESLN